MHQAAYDYVFKTFHELRKDRNDLHVLEVGSYNINGGVRRMITQFSERYHGIDPQEGPGVDEVIGGDKFVHPEGFDVVVSTEVFEHTPDWKKIVRNAHANLRQGGMFIATMAGEGRAPHSAVHGNAPYDWEHYANIGEWDLRQTLKDAGFSTYQTEYVGKDYHPDLRCWAIK